MKGNFLKSIVLGMVLLFSAENACAQSFLKKLGKGVTSVAEGMVDAVTQDSSSDTSSSSTTTTSTEESTVNTDSLKSELLATMTFEVKKVVETDDSGNKLLNDDGTERVRYLLIDQDGKVCDATTAKKLCSQRLGQYGKLLAKTGLGMAIGAAGGAMNGGGLEGALKGGAVGAVAGLALSATEMSNIKKLNKSLKNYRKTIAAYQKTFTDEGAQVDASVDLSNVDGIDFSKVETTTMPSSQIEKELAESKVLGEGLEDIDFDKL